MNAGSFDGERDVDAVIDQELAAAENCELPDLICKREQFPRTKVAFP
jgi:hypothetical protein